MDSTQFSPISGHVIVVGNHKQGSGKTTLAMHLVLSLLEQGYRVWSIDIDPEQRSFSHYLENRKRYMIQKNMTLPLPTTHTILYSKHKNSTSHSASPSDTLTQWLTDSASTHDFVVIDTPSTLSALSYTAYMHAHMLITPINYSVTDMEGMYETIIQPKRTQDGLHNPRNFSWYVMRHRYVEMNSRQSHTTYQRIAHLATSMDFKWINGLKERTLYRELFLRGLSLVDKEMLDQTVTLSLPYIAARQELRKMLRTLDLSRKNVLIHEPN